MIIRFENKRERCVFAAVVLATAAVAVLCGFAIALVVAPNRAVQETAAIVAQ